jgi:hypothetical protein
MRNRKAEVRGLSGVVTSRPATATASSPGSPAPLRGGSACNVAFAGQQFELSGPLKLRWPIQLSVESIITGCVSWPSMLS